MNLNLLQRVGVSIAIVCMVNQTAVRMLAEESEGNSHSDFNLTTTLSTLNVTTPGNVEADGPKCAVIEGSGGYEVS